MDNVGRLLQSLEVKGHSDLSRRERQLIELASRGHTDAEMAKELGLSLGTVATYWVRIRAKFGGSTRAELVAMALGQAYERELAEHSETHDEDLPLGFDLFFEIVKSAPEAIVVGDERGAICYANEACSSLFGYSPDELHGAALSSLIPERFRSIEPAVAPISDTHFAGTALHSSGAEFPMVGSVARVCHGAHAYTALFIAKSAL